MNALILLDVQNDFMPGGALAVPNGDSIIPVINAMMTQFDLVVATQDWHPANHISFASQHPGREVFERIELDGIQQTLWPDHCVQGSFGAEFHPDLYTNAIETIFRKGTNPAIDSYSGFYDNLHKKTTGLAGYLREKGVTDLYFCGLCADICVYYSIMDAYNKGFNCHLIENATCSLVHEDYEKIKVEYREKNIQILHSRDLNA